MSWEIKFCREARKEARELHRTTDEGREFHRGITVQKKEDKWRSLFDKGNCREWQERKERIEHVCDGSGSIANSCGGPCFSHNIHIRERMCSRRVQASVGRHAQARVSQGWSHLCGYRIALAIFTCIFSSFRKSAGDAPHQTAEQYSKRGRIKALKKFLVALLGSPCW